MTGALAGRVAIVTGGSKGIGRAIARAFVGAGAKVVLVQRGAAEGEALARELGADWALAVAADVGEPAAPGRIVGATLERWGRLDVLVNNAAAVPPRQDFFALTRQQLEEVVAVNLTGLALLSQAAAREMGRRAYGRIVHVGAIQAHLPLQRNTAYAASKGGVEALTRGMAVDLAPHGILVNAIAPGQVATDGATGRDADRESPTLLGRMGQPEEVAPLAVYLASEACSFMTGQVITVDGGRTLSRKGDPDWLA